MGVSTPRCQACPEEYRASVCKFPGSFGWVCNQQMWDLHPVTGAEWAVEEPGSPDGASPSQRAPLCAAGGQTAGLQGGAQSTCPRRLRPTQHPPPTPGKGDGATEPSREETVRENSGSLPLPLPQGTYALSRQSLCHWSLHVTIDGAL